MDATPSGSELLSSFTLCAYMLVIAVASVAGIVGALRARAHSASGAGPLAIAFAFGLMIFAATWFAIFEATPGSLFEWSELRRVMLLFGGLVDLGATGVLALGLLLTSPRKAAQ
ncbi:MAG: hypothetical protein KF729_15860 [Sandaracinaceae bacterium]|nr:hypothetical protein [Sandaracinaceae bacterium]